MRYAHACALLSSLLCAGEAFSNAAEGYAQGKSIAQSIVPQGVSSPETVPGFQGADVPEAHLSVGELEERAKERLSKAASEVASGDSSKLSAEGMILDSHLNKKYFPPSSFEELLKTSDEIVQDPTKVLNAEVEELPSKVVTKTTQETCEESAPPFLLEDTSYLTHTCIMQKNAVNDGDEIVVKHIPIVSSPENSWIDSHIAHLYGDIEISFSNRRQTGFPPFKGTITQPHGMRGTEHRSLYEWLPGIEYGGTYRKKIYTQEELINFLKHIPMMDAPLLSSSDISGFIGNSIQPLFKQIYFQRTVKTSISQETDISPLSQWQAATKTDYDLGPHDMGSAHDQWSLPTQFESLVDSGVCHYAGEECTQGPQTRVIAGAPVTRACWAKKRKYRCQFPSRNTCEELRQRGCTQVNSSCTKKMGDACAVYTQTYACRQVLTKPGRTRIRGKVPFCLDGSCHKVSYAPNQDMMEALSKLAALKQVAQDMDASARTVFRGKALACGSHCINFSSCCRVKGAGWGVSLGLSDCSIDEQELAKKRGEGKCVLTGTYCAKKMAGICILKKTNFCCFDSKLARVFHEEARRQLGMGFGSAKEPACQGLTFEQLASVDFEKIDLREVFSDLMARVAVPNPEALTRNFQQDWQARLPKAPSPQDPTSSPMGESIAQAKARQAPPGQDKTTNHTHISRDNTPEEHHELQPTNNLVF